MNKKSLSRDQKIICVILFLAIFILTVLIAWLISRELAQSEPEGLSATPPSEWSIEEFESVTTLEERQDAFLQAIWGAEYETECIGTLLFTVPTVPTITLNGVYAATPRELSLFTLTLIEFNPAVISTEEDWYIDVGGELYNLKQQKDTFSGVAFFYDSTTNEEMVTGYRNGNYFSHYYERP